jgi:inorganic phosphate transporter, PiT family
VQTVGSRITRITPVQGFCASAGGAIMLFAATYLGIPVSTTHTVTGAVIGVGAAQKASAVRWNSAGNILIAWVITLLAAALMAALCYGVSKLFS